MSNTNEPGTSTSLSEASNKTVYTIAAVRAEYARADGFCTEVQSFCGKAGIPAINELRNAGKHLLDALDDENGISSQDELHSAVGHARRAAYEAFEAGILTALEIIKKFKDDYSTIVVSTVVPDYAGILQKAAMAQRAVEAGRAKDFDRASDHTDRMESFRELRGLCETLDICRDEANKLVQARLDGERAGARSTLIGYVSIALAAASVIFGGPAFIDWLKKPSVEAKPVAFSPKIIPPPLETHASPNSSAAP